MKYSQLRKYCIETRDIKIWQLFSFIAGSSSLNFLDTKDRTLCCPKYNENLFPEVFLRAKGHFQPINLLPGVDFFFIIFFKFMLCQKCLCDPMWLRFWIFTFLPHPTSWFLCLSKGWLVIIWLKCSIYYNGLPFWVTRHTCHSSY